MAITNPNDLADIHTWLDLQQHVAVDDDPISTLEDFTAAHDFTASLTTRPLYKTNVVNGHPVARFDGTNDFMLASMAGIVQPFTVAMVLKTAATIATADDGYFSGTSYTGMLAAAFTTDTYYAYSGASLAGGALSAGAFTTVVAVFNGASSLIRVNGVEVTGDVGANSMTSVMLLGVMQQDGSGTPDASTYAAFDLGEFVICSDDLTAGEITDLETYFAAHWAAAPVVSDDIHPAGCVGVS